MDMLDKFGITTTIKDESDPVNDMNPAALALGAMCNGVEPLEMALAYAAFPGGGKRNTPICYTQVLDRNGEVLLEGKSTSVEAMNEGVAWIMTDVLKSVVRANGYSIGEVVTGGKTGTTNEKYDIWFDGFTPTYAASLWIGTDQNVEMSTLSYMAARLWGKIMGQIPKACKGKYAKQPSNVIQRYGEYFTEGTETGLVTYISPEEKKKIEERKRKEAYAKWLKDREKHKTWVDEKYHYETSTVHHDAVTHTEKVQDGTETVQVGEDEDGNPIYEERPVYKEVTVVDKEAWDEEVKVKVVDKKGYWKYDKGYGEGEFKYRG